jgi:hypothetical protein
VHLPSALLPAAGLAAALAAIGTWFARTGLAIGHQVI